MFARKCSASVGKESNFRKYCDAISQRSLEKLMCFLRHEVESEEMIRLAREGFVKDRGGGVIRKECQKSVHKDEPTAATLISSTTGAKLNCIFCNRPHLSKDCQNLFDMSYEDRKSQVIRKRCCLVCLKVGHLAKRCHSNVRCLICKRRRYPLLFPDLREEKESNFSSKGRTADNEQRSTETLLTNLPSEHEIYLKTIMIRLRNRDKEVCVRALLDDGSQRSYIEKNLAAKLFLSPSGREIFSQGLFGRGIFPASEHERYMEDQDNQMVLGLSWDVVSDELSCKLPSNIDCTQGNPVTKRVLLSVINSTYDLIGFTAPALLLLLS
ncbi:integrase catalytic domain-containing protein [Nephila pilipes]|uniref:Integrase catalytic domain-containing protein n=1 Tax=Nephila pilipes TaxID=299642 RepID=A0A8X6UBC3_NEPPI|nr:integrase catalytic domain-containing protein [Nephila pilipes]